MKQLLTLLFIGLTSLYAQTVPSYVPTNGLVGWWPFNGNANDESGNGNNGSVNGASLTSDRNSNTNSAYSFDGINDFIVANSNSLYVSDTLTISIWINTNSTPPIISNYTIFELGGTGGSGVRWGCIAEPGNAVMAIGRGCGGVGNAPISTSYNGGWSNFIFVVSGLNQSIYYNGNLIGNSTNSQITSLSCSIANLYFGVSQWSSSFYFTGKLDDIGIWNRALATSEIQGLFQSCPDTIQTQPQNFTAYSSTGWANFKCESSDTAATYQWQQSNGSGWLDLTNLGNYSGATSDSLVITGVTASMNNYGYRCIVTGCTTDTSDVAVLTVENGIGLGESALQKLTVSPNPTNDIVSLNTSIVGSYQLLTLDGRVLESGTAKRDYDLTKYPNGVYHLKLSTDEGTRVLKVVKN
jgi:hypothetical protein